MSIQLTFLCSVHYFVINVFVYPLCFLISVNIFRNGCSVQDEGMPSYFVVIFSTTYHSFFVHRRTLTFMYPRQFFTLSYLPALFPKNIPFP